MSSSRRSRSKSRQSPSQAAARGGGNSQSNRNRPAGHYPEDDVLFAPHLLHDDYEHDNVMAADAQPRTSHLPTMGNLTSLFRRRSKTPQGRRSAAGTGTTSTTSPGNSGLSPRRIPPLQTPTLIPVGPQTATTTSSNNNTTKNRIVFSTHDGPDDDDDGDATAARSSSSNHQRDAASLGSYSRPSASDSGTWDRRTYNTGTTGTTTTGTSSAGTHSVIGTILRYRGFSTSIQNLFLDEPLVCASMGCFGLVLSNRTEYLLQLRNDRRGVRWGRSTSSRTLPSKLVAYALLLTLLCIMITFVIWGFGSNSRSTSLAEGWYEGYGNDDRYQKKQKYDDDEYKYAQQQQQDDLAVEEDDWTYTYGGNRGLGTANSKSLNLPHAFNGIVKIRDVHEGLWVPALGYFTALRDEWRSAALEERSDVTNRALANSQTNGDDDGAQQQQQQQSYSRDLASDIRVSFIITFMIVLGVLGRRRRMRTRYYLVRARAQEDHLFYASSGAGIRRVAFQDSREDQYEGACSHTLCGCYPVDPPMEGDEIDDDVMVDDDGVIQHKKTPQYHDCVSLAFNCLMACCCGLICKCWCQCMSICALAQEAREIRLLVPTRYQRIDYLTHQPFHEYQKSVNEIRRGWLGKSRIKAGVVSHVQALSRLSRYILVGFIGCFITITATLMFNPRASFSWPDLVILVATFLQSFFVIFFVHWIFHKSDLSLDAVIKFFAAGFLIAVPAAFFFEGMLVNISLTIAYTAYAIGVKISETFTLWVVENYKWLWVIGELFNAYIVAAITEELCKYYTFRCVEHPDLIFLTGLAKVSQDERAVAGGIVKYPFSADQVEETNKFEAYNDDGDRSVASRGSHRSTGRKNKIRNVDETPLPLDDEFKEDEQDIRTHRQKAMAVTTGMISVAVGLACAENFLYVFLLGGSEANAGDVQSGGVVEEWIVLLFRSLFPIHALAAAMQSINVIRKYIECDTDYSRRIGVYRIILPAVIMHGSFDAILLGINIYIESAWDAYLKKNGGNFDAKHPPYNPILVNLVAWLSIILIMLAGLSWYYHQNRLQRQRLIILEGKEKAATAANPSYSGPSATSPRKHVSEVELV